MITVSVIIPVYNGERYIDDCINCINNQTLNDLEVIFVNDGSSDNSLQKLKKYEGDNISIYTQCNAGASVARNRGIREAKGKYIAFLDIDDRWANKNTLKTLYEKAEEYHALICGGSFGSSECEILLDDKRVFSEEGFVKYSEYQYDFGFTRFIYNRKMIVENQIYFPRYRIFEDPVFMVNAMVVAKLFYAIPDVVYIYSGEHQKNLNVEKTVDYLHGIRDNLLISSKYGYAYLHKENFERLETLGSYYAEINMVGSNESLFESLISVNAVIDKELLRSIGINLSNEYIIPALRTVWRSSCNYFKLRKFFSIKTYLKWIRKNN